MKNSCDNNAKAMKHKRGVEKVLGEFFSGNSHGDLIDKLEAYAFSVVGWGKVHNITSKHNDIGDVWISIFDSIACISRVKNFIENSSDGSASGSVIDAGTGAGFPGIPLSLIFPRQHFFLVDADRKKCSFLRSVKSLLGLKNVTVVNRRLETLNPVSLVVTRALFSPPLADRLVAAAQKGGNIAIWATPDSAGDFIQRLADEGVALAQKFDYRLPDDKKRRLLIFSI